jgi:hypothetical protein
MAILATLWNLKLTILALLGREYFTVSVAIMGWLPKTWWIEHLATSQHDLKNVNATSMFTSSHKYPLSFRLYVWGQKKQNIPSRRPSN